MNLAKEGKRLMPKLNPPRLSARGRWPLAAEITLLLLLKLALLFVLAKTFFSQPEAPHMRMPVERVSERLLAAPAATPKGR